MAEAGFRVTGRVQGVGFRWWTRSLATRLGLSGSVRNLSDGSVAVHARGTDDQLAELKARHASELDMSKASGWVKAALG